MSGTPVEMVRQVKVADIAITASIGNTPAIDVAQYAFAGFGGPAGLTSITWYCASKENGTYRAIAAGAQAITADRWNKVPEEVMGAAWAKAVGNTGATIELVRKG